MSAAAVLKQNIQAMHETQQSPSFVQTLFTFEIALAEIERLRSALREVDQYLVIGGKAEKIVRRALGDEAP